MSAPTRGRKPSAAKHERTGRRRGWVDAQSAFWYRAAQVIFSFLFRFWGEGLIAIGTDNVPAEGGAFLVANHTSAIDPFVVGLPISKRILRGPGKFELFSNPIMGFLMRKIGIFPLRRDGVDATAVRTMVELYRSGQIVIVFPEGGRSKSGDLIDFNPGFTRLAIKLRAPLIPAGTAGARDILPISTAIPRRGVRVAVAYGKPFELFEFYDGQLTPERLAAATHLLKERVAEMIATAERARR